MEDALQTYRPFSRQQDAIDFAEQCNAAAVEAEDDGSQVHPDPVKVFAV